VRYWLTQPGADLIASHAQQREPHPSDGRGDKPWEDVHPVLVFRENNATMAILPLMVNARTLLPRLGETSGSALEIVIQSFSLSVQAMRGPQAGSSWVQLAWQRLERGSDAFIAPIARRKLRQRLSATVGTGDTRQKRQISADMYSEGAPERLSGALRGGINWRLTHD
jgi:hypothetical protein